MNSPLQAPPKAYFLIHTIRMIFYSKYMNFELSKILALTKDTENLNLLGLQDNSLLTGTAL